VEVNEDGLKPKIGLARTAGMNPGSSTAMDVVVEEVAIPRRSVLRNDKGWAGGFPKWAGITTVFRERSKEKFVDLKLYR
jgi:hypothetical protein